MFQSYAAPNHCRNKAEDGILPRMKERDQFCARYTAGRESVAKPLHGRFLEGVVAGAPRRKCLTAEGEYPVAIGAQVIWERRKPME